jgi:chromosome segregation ATPase
VARSIDEILAGDALTWANLKPDQLFVEHEALRRALGTSREQTSALVAQLATVERERDEAIAEFRAHVDALNAEIEALEPRLREQAEPMLQELATSVANDEAERIAAWLDGNADEWDRRQLMPQAGATMRLCARDIRAHAHRNEGGGRE